MSWQTTHLFIWGEHCFKTLTPLLGDEPPEHVIVLTSTEDTAQIEEFFHSRGISAQMLVWPEQRAQASDFNRLEALLCATPSDNFIYNASGGSRLLAMQLLHWCQEAGIESFAIDHSDCQVWLDGVRPTVRVEDRANLRFYFAAHQVEVLGQGMAMPISPALRKLCSDWVLDIDELGESFRALNYLASQADNPRLSTRVGGRANAGLDILLADLCDSSLITRDGQDVVFRDEASRFFANGGWLELFVYAQVQQLKRELPMIQEVWISAQLKYPEGVKNELDVVFLANNQLHIIEVKTACLANKPAAANQVLYKLDALAGALGDDYAKAMVVSLYELPKTSVRRAEVLDVTVISATQLQRIRSRIRRWIVQAA